MGGPALIIRYRLSYSASSRETFSPHSASSGRRLRGARRLLHPENTAGTRFWHSFTTRYNVYYNGHEAYLKGCLAKEKGNKDNYTELLPFFLVGNENSRTLGKSDFETAITKCEKAIQLHSIKKRPAVSPSKRRSPKMKAYLKRQEFNPFLKNAWLLMGQAQFQKGDFVEAASTFSYITRHYAQEPDVVAEARIWLARSYSELEWFYDAGDALEKLGRDSVPTRLRREQDATTANLLLRQASWPTPYPTWNGPHGRSRANCSAPASTSCSGRCNRPSTTPPRPTRP